MNRSRNGRARRLSTSAAGLTATALTAPAMGALATVQPAAAEAGAITQAGTVEAYRPVTDEMLRNPDDGE